MKITFFVYCQKIKRVILQQFFSKSGTTTIEKIINIEMLLTFAPITATSAVGHA